MKFRFFSFDGDSLEIHETAEEARARADDAIEYFREDASEGWDELVTQIVWGEVLGEVIETMHRPYDEDEDCHIEKCDFVVDYGLSDRPEAPTAAQAREMHSWGGERGEA